MNIRTAFCLLLSLISFSPFAINPKVQLSTEESWAGTNREKINALINQYGKHSPSYDAKHKPVAAFDWDNTMMKNDIGEATLLWMVAQGKLKRPASFKKMNAWLTEDALQELETHCAGTSDYLPTQEKPTCADTLLNIYHDDLLANRTQAWLPSPDPERIYPRYFFYAQLFAGYTPEEIRGFSEQAFQLNKTNPIGQTQKIGSKDYTAYVRVYSQMNNLVSVLKQNGFDVWIISASIQPSVEVAAREMGIDKDHVIGVRQMLDKKGQLTDTFQGCGPYPDGNKEIISNRLGKRCWLNKVVFNKNQMKEPAPIIFAAGDSDGDLVFLKDAKGGRLVINKNNPELLCHAYQNADGKWIINPMFIQPKPPLNTAYKCDAFHIPDQVEKS